MQVLMTVFRGFGWVAATDRLVGFPDDTASSGTVIKITRCTRSVGSLGTMWKHYVSRAVWPSCAQSVKTVVTQGLCCLGFTGRRTRLLGCMHRLANAPRRGIRARGTSTDQSSFTSRVGRK